MQVVILAGGFGTRLATQTQGIPKPMVPLAGKPLLQHQVEMAVAHGASEILMLLHHQADVIESHFGDGSNFGTKISYHIEDTPLGTAGALLDNFDALADRFFIFYGDTAMDIDLGHFMRYHQKKEADATLLVHPNDHPYDSDLIEADIDNWIHKFHSYPHPEGKSFSNLVNAACYIIEKKALSQYKSKIERSDLAKNLFPKMVDDNHKIAAYRSREYIKDMGTPERLEKVETALQNGLVNRLSRRNESIAVFIDRDGTINEEVNRVSDAKDFKIMDNTAAAIRKLNKAGLLAIVITNQPVIARGDCTEEELKNIHNILEWELGKSGAYFDAIYYCPHHPDKGFEGERPELKFACDCRKPAIGMFEQAKADMGINLPKSWMIGDTTVDMLAAQNAGLSSVLVETGHGGKDGRHIVNPDKVCADLNTAIDFILETVTSEDKGA